MRSVLAITLLSVASFADGQPPPTLADALTRDSSLHAVHFVDRAHGCAVGDRGLVLRTEDGGATWRRVRTPTDARLEDVVFVDRRHGWAVGGSVRPYTHESRGVVLGTEDGGLSWRVVARDTVPRLRSIAMVDHRRGVAAGVGTPLFPSGVFSTDDGGRHWSVVGGPTRGDWLATGIRAERSGDPSGALIGVLGEVRTLMSNDVSSAMTPTTERRAADAVIGPDGAGWMVGRRGAVLTTRDGGRTWREPPSPPPGAGEPWFDWRAVAARGERVWTVGAPGSAVLSSIDAGRTWNISPTGSTSPLSDVYFIDTQHGWAVGELGVVLHTSDGGQSWQAQRGAERRAAALFVLGTPDDLPAELLAATAAGEGRRVAVVAPAIAGDDAEAARSFARLSEAVSQLGGDAVLVDHRPSFDARHAESPLAVLRERLGEQSVRAITERIRGAIVSYRPDVVAVAARGGMGEFLDASALAATEAARLTPPPFVRAAPWSVRRLVRVAEEAIKEGPHAYRLLDTGEHVAQLGTTSAQWRPEARGLLSADRWQSPDAFVGWSIDPDTPPPRGGMLVSARDAPDSAARRAIATAPITRLDQLRRIAARRAQYDALLARTEANEEWGGSVVNLTGGLDARAGAELLDRLANDYADVGRKQLWAETLYLLARRYPESPRADAALLDLVRYYASAEWDHFLAQPRRSNTPLPLANIDASLKRFTEPADSDRSERARKLIDFFRSARPALHARPSVRMSEAAMLPGDTARPALLSLNRPAHSELWRQAASRELAMRIDDRTPSGAVCSFAPQRPQLDGRFDEPIWLRSTELVLADPDGQSVATARIARDEEFLFLSIQATSQPAPAGGPGPRRRDEDLAGVDRVRLSIDVDRDYQTAFELTVDRSGRTHDALDGDPGWDPRWYVATGVTPDGWTAEAAIHLEDLVAADEVEEAIWAVSFDRRRPHHPRADWPSEPGDRLGPRRFGLLGLE